MSFAVPVPPGRHPAGGAVRSGAGRGGRLLRAPGGHRQPGVPPYLWRDPQDPKRLIGANADLLQRLGKELGVRIDVLYSGSWEKAQEEVTSGRADLLAGAYLTLARLGSMDYVHPPFLMTSGVVWVNEDAAFRSSAATT